MPSSWTPGEDVEGSCYLDFSPHCLYFALRIRCRQGTISFHCKIPAFFLVFLFFLIYNKKGKKGKKKERKERKRSK